MRAHPLLALSVLTVLLVAGCATVPIGFESDPSGDYVHIHSGMRFPEVVGDFGRYGAGSLDGAALDVMVGYKVGADKDDPASTLMTVFVYPSENATLEREYEVLMTTIRSAHPELELISEEDTQRSYMGQPTAGKRSRFLFQAYGQQLTGGLDLFKYGPWFIRYVSRFEPKNEPKALEEIDSFLESLPWPVLR
jgi:hypothetical protein